MAAIHDDQHFPGHWDGESVIVVTCATTAVYNSLELLLLIFSTFKERRGLYFWSLTISSTGVLPYFTGFMCEYFKASPFWIAMLIGTVGWVALVTGQSFVLYSRLNLLVHNTTLLKRVKWMIIIDAIILHTSDTVVNFGRVDAKHPTIYDDALFYIEKIQMTAFCIQEFILSGIYLRKAVELLKIVSKNGARRVMIELFIINVIIVLMDIGLLALEYDGLRTMERTWKGLFYSIKLKLEFVILGKLVDIVKPPKRSTTCFEDVSTFVDLSKSKSISQRSDTALHSSIRKLSSNNSCSKPNWTNTEYVEDMVDYWPTKLNGPRGF